jgi:hypothetical protein
MTETLTPTTLAPRVTIVGRAKGATVSLAVSAGTTDDELDAVIAQAVSAYQRADAMVNPPVDVAAAGWKISTATRLGDCERCQGSIHPGEQVEWCGSRSTLRQRHAVCP